jgi:site-specific DNA recombinase
METFDKCSVRFVPVTQQLDTRSSLGRLSLNVLLSFAQLERESIAERTRDKISAACRKGNGPVASPVLGYNVDPRGGRLIETVPRRYFPGVKETPRSTSP